MSGGPLNLAPVFLDDPHLIRAEDGIGMYSYGPSAAITDSVAFAFESGEVWSVDTRMMTYFPDGIPIGEIEKVFTDRLPKYAHYIASLGLHAPFRWVAGISNVKGRYLRMPVQSTSATYRGPECLAPDIIVEGDYDGTEPPADALAPFFNMIYHKCGMQRPKQALSSN